MDLLSLHNWASVRFISSLCPQVSNRYCQTAKEKRKNNSGFTQVFDHYFQHSLPIQIYQLIMLVLVIAFSLIRSLKVLAPFSLIANVITIGGLMTMIVKSKRCSSLFHRFIGHHAISRSVSSLLQWNSTDNTTIGMAGVLRFGDVCLRRNCFGKNERIGAGEGENIGWLRFYRFNKKWKIRNRTADGSAC